MSPLALGPPWFAHDLAIVLVHFLWQGALIAGLAAVASACVFHRAESRYRLYLVSLALMCAAPVVTYLSIPGPVGAVGAIAEGRPRPVEGASRPVALDAASALEFRAAGDPAPLSVAPQSTTHNPATWPIWLVGCWFAGVLLMAIRLALGLRRAGQLKRGGRAAPADIARTAAVLARRLGMKRQFAVKVNDRVGEAFVVGCFGPVIVLPTAWLTGMSPSVVQAVLAHELAHLRRWDLWVNLFQRVVETLLFYHPAVWWVSGRVHRERELCCDAMAAAAVGNRASYAWALAWAARRRTRHAQPAMAAALGGHRMKILERVRNVLGQEDASRRLSWWPVGLVVAILAGGVYLATADFSGSNQAVADDNREGDAERDGDREREGDRPRDGDRERGERDRPREGDRDRERGERNRPREGVDRDRERGDRDRPRDGDRERDGDRRRDGDREREGYRRDGDRERERDRPREGDRRIHGPNRELIEMVQALRREVERLRHELHELRRHEEMRRQHDRRKGGPDRERFERERAERERVFREHRERAERERAERIRAFRERAERERDGDREREREGDREREREGDRERERDRERDREREGNE